jgi:cytochrome c-type biogenesis protein CcmH
MNLLGLLWIAVAYAKDPVQEGTVDVVDGVALDGMPSGPAGAAPHPDDVDRIAHDIAAKLRCPVCQGLSAADSTSAAALAMQKRIKELVAAGYDEQQIQDYFTERYSEWILLEPSDHGLNQILWLLPWVGAGLGVGIAAWTLANWQRRRAEVQPLPAERTDEHPKDRYERMLLDQLRDDP